MKPVFYCENCQKEVSANDKVCPNCSKFFTDVRCPRCNHSGDVDDFSIGCPKCGYMNPAWIKGPKTASSASFFEVVSPELFETPSALSPFGVLPREEAPRLPYWAFLSLTLGLGTLCAAAVYIFLGR